MNVLLFNVILPQEKFLSFVHTQTFTYFDILNCLTRLCFDFEAKAKKCVGTGSKLGFFFVTFN